MLCFYVSFTRSSSNSRYEGSWKTVRRQQTRGEGTHAHTFCVNCQTSPTSRNHLETKDAGGQNQTKTMSFDHFLFHWQLSLSPQRAYKNVLLLLFLVRRWCNGTTHESIGGRFHLVNTTTTPTNQSSITVMIYVAQPYFGSRFHLCFT